MPYYFPLILIAIVCCSGLWPERLAAQTSERFKRFDRDGDGKLSTAEVNRIPPLKTRLDGADRNRDGYYTIEEIRAHISGGGRPDQAKRSSRIHDHKDTLPEQPRDAPRPGLPATPGSRKQLPDSDAVRDAAGTGQLFEAIHVPGFTDFREGLNGYAFADLDGNGYLDLVTVTTPPFALDGTWSDGEGSVQRTRKPTDRLRLLLNFGDFRLQSSDITLAGSAATPDDFSQGWRGAQMPALADFNGDGLYDIFVTRQCPMKGGRVTRGMKPVGCSLLLAQNSFHEFQDVSRKYGALNELAYNRSVSLGDVNQDGFLDIAIGADNVFNAFEGLPKSALFVFEPQDEEFEGGKFTDVGGTKVVPDFGGFFHDRDRDKAGPVVSLRDIDNDGDLDLLQSCHVMLPPNMSRLTSYSPGEYRHGIFNWRNTLSDGGEFAFEKVTHNGFAAEGQFQFNPNSRRFEPAGSAAAPALPYLFFGDVNNDSYLDAVGFWLTPFATDRAATRFWHNRGNYEFAVGSRAAKLDVLNDSYNDWFRFFDANVDSRALSEAARRTQRIAGSVIGPNRLDQPPRYADAVFADFNNDGWTDLVVVDRMENDELETRSFLLMNRGDGTFEPKPTTFSGIDATGLSAEAVDLDNDGLLDLIVGADPDNSGETADIRRYESIVYHNTGLHGARENHWLRVRFDRAAGARVYGTRIDVFDSANGKLLGSRGIYNNVSYRSSAPPEAHFGLGKTARVHVVVHPIGREKFSIEAVDANRYVSLDLDKRTLKDVLVSNRRVTVTETPRQPETGAVNAFTFLREESFSCGGQTHTVKIYRNEVFAEALGLRANETDIACEFILVPAGNFTIGSSKAEQDAMAKSRPGRNPIANSASPFYSRTGESPQHEVTVPEFLMARTEVTQQLWRSLARLGGLPESPSFFANAGKRAPVEQVSFEDVTSWMNAINKAHGLALRLPSEAEWEYACRAGTSTAIYNGDMTIRGHCDCPEVDEIGWYMGNCGVDYAGGVNSSRWPERQYNHRRGGSHPVGTKRENAFGLFDMIGNVMEWCEDHAHANYEGAPTDGSAWLGGDCIVGSRVNGPLSRDDSKAVKIDNREVPGRVRRGGSWRQFTYNIRSAMRSFRGPKFADSNQGFRVASDLPVNKNRN